MTDTAPPPASRPKRYRFVIVVGAIVIAAVAVAHIYPGAPSPKSTLPRLKIVPHFSLTERSGRTITNNDLFGKIWVADFVYTTCPGPCPLVTASMATVQKAVAPDPRVQIVTITVDPANDTPAVLAAYADKFHADKDRWWFLTGREKDVYALVQNGFLLPVIDNHGKPLEPGEYTVTHSTQVALVDTNGIVRGYFDGVSADGRAALLKAIAELEKNPS